ncbi:ABC transporter ATP-binding protein [Corynebacterium terpenotabidum]|uniref:ABC transporter domain-containing protein n=1 Tax=Corynebacterium terpenotabidum Y-11 TaxID=1200352 RepID=S4XH97_9CORY|nr:ATP-binding cassette domain-containing protein [Corynebacterium terpenotabidum]AGP31921.1 hypothetical protein A606_11410 [Corynebacterium terpenotabidum Y-11]
MITTTDLTRSFGRRRPVTPVRGITHTFPDACVSYVLGLNGTGKSTLLRLLSGVQRPTSGQVRVDGRAPHAWPTPGTRIGLLLDSAAVSPSHTGRRHLRWIAAASGVSAADADRWLHRVGLDAVAGDPVAGYSLGMRQRLGIAGALLGEPHNVILDEPLNGLDVAGMLWLRGLLRSLAADGRCVIVASHHLAEVELSADEVVLLDGGSIIAAGDLATVRGPHPTLEDAFLHHIPRASRSVEVIR